MKIGILEPDNFSEKAIKNLQMIGEVSLCADNRIKDFVKDKNCIFVRLNHYISANLLNNAPELRYICSPTTGLNHIDIVYTNENHIDIISLKGEKDFLNTIRATPEHTLGLILSLLRNYKHAFLNQENSVWDRNPLRGYEIFQSRVGIIGLGRVGKILSKYLHAMGAEIFYYDMDGSVQSDWATSCNSLDELINSSDIVVLSASYQMEKSPILGKSQIHKLQNKFFINTARAELTDELYLLQMAKNNHFKGLAIDVITNEQEEENLLSEWLAIDSKNNIIITPHIGGATYTSMHRTEEFITDKFISRIS